MFRAILASGEKKQARQQASWRNPQENTGRVALLHRQRKIMIDVIIVRKRRTSKYFCAVRCCHALLVPIPRSGCNPTEGFMST